MKEAGVKVEELWDQIHGLEDLASEHASALNRAQKARSSFLQHYPTVDEFIGVIKSCLELNVKEMEDPMAKNHQYTVVKLEASIRRCGDTPFDNTACPQLLLPLPPQPPLTTLTWAHRFSLQVADQRTSSQVATKQTARCTPGSRELDPVRQYGSRRASWSF